MNDQSTNTRREFLRAGGRYVSLGVLIIGATALMKSRDAEGKCARRSPCPRCSEFAGCTLPPAMSQRSRESHGA